MARMETYGISDPGKVRENNEDCFYIPTPESQDHFVLVADGMGGHIGGEVASSTCRDAICLHMREGHKRGLRGPDLVRDAIAKANWAIWDTARRYVRYRGMGTTLVMAMLEAGEWVLGHVGDSRIYLFRDGRLAQLTSDHTMVQEMVKSGFLTPEQALRHPQRHLITRAMGVDDLVQPDIMRLAARGGDVLLLCSDGLTDALDAEDILILLSLPDSLERRARRLVAVANQRGGPDNITVVLAQLPEGVNHG